MAGSSRAIRSRSATGLDFCKHFICRQSNGEPDNLHALRNYAVLLTGAHDDSLKNGNRALGIAEKLGPQTGIDHWFVLSIPAAAHAELRDFRKAVELAAWSPEAAPEEQKASGAGRLDQFPQHRPFRCESLAANHQQPKRSQ